MVLKRRACVVWENMVKILTEIKSNNKCGDNLKGNNSDSF